MNRSSNSGASAEVADGEPLHVHLVVRNEMHRRFPELSTRVGEMDAMLQTLKALELAGKSTTLQRGRCLKFSEETDKILSSSSGMTVAVQSFSSRCTTPLRPSILQPPDSRAVVVRLREGNGIGEDTKSDGSSQNKGPKEEETMDYGEYYGAKASQRWWWMLCVGGGKGAKHGDGAENVRDLWNTQVEFFLSCLGFIVGVGNTLRFPSMIFRHGGAFFIPYFFCLIAFGLPLVYMHLSIGQYSGLSASGAFWRMMPIASGIGWALVLLAVPVAIYYNIIVAWSLYYFWFSFLGLFSGDGLPWTNCTEEWIQRYNCCELQSAYKCQSTTEALTSQEAFFHFQVLNRTSVSEPYLGPVQGHLFVALAIAWRVNICIHIVIIVFFGVFKGLGSIGSAVSVTATAPYLLLLILLLRGISLDGALHGISFLFQPSLSRLWSLSMWRTAAEQVFYSLGIDAGPLISMASFSRYRNNIYRDAVLLVLINTATSILCGLVIFSFVGFMVSQTGAREQGKEITSILRHDSLYIAFTVYPGVASLMEWGFLWAALFFLMLTLSALDAEFAWLEMIAASIMNQFGSKEKAFENRLLIVMCIFCFLCGIPLCARGGIFIFHAIEHLNANWNAFSLSLLQLIVVCYIYEGISGVNNYLEDMSEMLRVKAEEPPKKALNIQALLGTYWRKTRRFFGPVGGYIKWTWCLICPVILLILLIASVLSYERVSFNGVVLPLWYELVAWLVMIGPLCIMPITIALTIHETRKRKRSWRSLISSEHWRHSKKKEEECEQPKHTEDAENLYDYIISRGVSTKSRRGVGALEIHHAAMEDDAHYSHVKMTLNALGGAGISSHDVTAQDFRNRISPTLLSERLAQASATRDATFADRSPGDSISQNEKQTPAASSPSEQESISEAQTAFSDFNLFGPPPEECEIPHMHSSTIPADALKLKRRSKRRSDQRRNRLFASREHFIELVSISPKARIPHQHQQQHPLPHSETRNSCPTRDNAQAPKHRLRSRTEAMFSIAAADDSTSTRDSPAVSRPRQNNQLPPLKRPMPIYSPSEKRE